jgi:hypothetical protein
VSTPIDLAADKRTTDHSKRNSPSHIGTARSSSTTSAAEDATNDRTFDTRVIVDVVCVLMLGVVIDGERVFVNFNCPTTLSDTADLNRLRPATNASRIINGTGRILFSVHFLEALVRETSLSISCEGSGGCCQSDASAMVNNFMSL